MEKIINERNTFFNQLGGETISLEEFVKLYESHPEAITESTLILPQPGRIFGSSFKLRVQVSNDGFEENGRKMNSDLQSQIRHSKSQILNDDPKITFPV